MCVCVYVCVYVVYYVCVYAFVNMNLHTLWHVLKQATKLKAAELMYVCVCHVGVLLMYRSQQTCPLSLCCNVLAHLCTTRRLCNNMGDPLCGCGNWQGELLLACVDFQWLT